MDTRMASASPGAAHAVMPGREAARIAAAGIADQQLLGGATFG
jgi:hypothetical protein